MRFVLTPEEFEEKKSEFKSTIDKFLSDYSDFIKVSSPSNWRGLGNAYSEVKKLKKYIDEIEPLTLKHLDSDVVRDGILTDEEKEEWEAMKKYNL